MNSSSACEHLKCSFTLFCSPRSSLNKCWHRKMDFISLSKGICFLGYSFWWNMSPLNALQNSGIALTLVTIWLQMMQCANRCYFYSNWLYWKKGLINSYFVSANFMISLFVSKMNIFGSIYFSVQLVSIATLQSSVVAGFKKHENLAKVCSNLCVSLSAKHTLVRHLTKTPLNVFTACYLFASLVCVIM